MANNDKENKIKKFTKEAIGKTLNQFNKEIGIADLVEINKNQDRILNGILSQVNDENTEKTEKSNIITLDNSTDGIVELKEIQGDTNVNVSKIEEMPITHDIGDKEGNVFTLNEIPKGAISIGEIQGNTMVNCNKDDKKELVLMKDLSTQGDNSIAITEGVDGGKVDVALEGNTLVNVSKTKDSTAISKAYTVENSGNHVALQGEYDGSCRPVITGNTLVNLITYSNLVTRPANTNGSTALGGADLKGGVTYTISYELVQTSTSTDNGFGYYPNGATFWYGHNKTNTTLNNTIGRKTYTFKLSEDKGGYCNFRWWTNTCSVDVIVKDFILLEGDYSDKPIPNYFDG